MIRYFKADIKPKHLNEKEYLKKNKYTLKANKKTIEGKLSTKFSDKTRLKITVCNYPPATSKWNYTISPNN
ncbi:hypothetical protein GF327_04125 [Candidatus Woesearchaeota archaeon]|nr:hypothetical protein [Candidatus Woesearchaeota archaeon]